MNSVSKSPPPAKHKQPKQSKKQLPTKPANPVQKPKPKIKQPSPKQTPRQISRNAAPSNAGYAGIYLIGYSGAQFQNSPDPNDLPVPVFAGTSPKANSPHHPSSDSDTYTPSRRRPAGRGDDDSLFTMDDFVQDPFVASKQQKLDSIERDLRSILKL